MHVVDSTDDKLYLYALAVFPPLHSDNDRPRGVWGNADTIWVAQDDTGTDNKIYAYKRADGTRDSSKDFNTLEAANNSNIDGIWSDGTTMFVVDTIDDKIYAYKMSDKSHDSDKDITLHSFNGSPVGIWGSDTTIWVSEDDNPPRANKVFAYKRADGMRDSS